MRQTSRGEGKRNDLVKMASIREKERERNNPSPAFLLCFHCFCSYEMGGIRCHQAAATSAPAAAAAPKSFSRHWPQTASKPLTTSPQTRPASRSRSRRSQSPRSIHRVPSSRPSSSRRMSATSSRADRSLREAVDVSCRDSYRVSLRPRSDRVMSDVCEIRVCREMRGSRAEDWGVVGLDE
ncbi:hypothetical protein BO70DRAFT_29707 [Aspergillus heteromorphus CBS 117.55]|uniref:Uncharacterized protein n=1 Tax=Aspergillus heteromorphus CBS 117.55 TaxID=1448321 RepID=A0A317WA99_9EURO|nr:uncharacterized protein BO70DRAFT_29707 [Aspergillus heteromorphus CBS 117.55]PWY82815.1 hypothetical protein BO70DRAFT_29707 [Aspergillus heteromorphus CBS 117.55]